MSASRSAESAGAEPPGAAQLLGQWARLLFATLRDAGVADLWVSPGSRSTPFTWAALHTPGLTLRSVIDERSAAFLALGHTRVTGRPCALLCTSGTAAANYFPAVVEASLSHLPLIVLTADRPPDVQHAAAAQSIDQIKLYGDHVRRFYDVGLPDAAPSALAALRRSVAQAVAESRGPLPGPVHLNLRAKKPLEPAAASSDAERALQDQIGQLIARPVARHAPLPCLANETVLAAARTLSSAASGAIIVGPLPAYGGGPGAALAPRTGASLGQTVAELARLTGFPIFAEAASQLRFELADHELSFPLFDWLLSAPDIATKLRPELVLCIGQTPTSSAFERWVAQVPRRLVLAEHGYPDALGSAELVASGTLSVALPALVAELKTLAASRGSSPASTPRAREAGTIRPAVGDAAPAEPVPFRDGVARAHARCRELLDEALDDTEGALSEGAAVRAIVEGLPDAAVLVLGNSLPIRDVDGCVARAARVRVVSQRGANGIDGLISGAIGSAIGSGAPTLLLVGDVSFLHDLGALASASLVTTPLVIAVIDNAGGRIFDQLPVRELYAGDGRAQALWLTPPARELSHAAALFGLRHASPSTLLEIRSAVATGLNSAGVTLLQVRVVPDSARMLRQRVLSGLQRPLPD